MRTCLTDCRGAVLQDVVLMGQDYYEHEHRPKADISPAFPPMGVGEGSVITRAIIDKNARIGKHCQLVNSQGLYRYATLNAHTHGHIHLVPTQ